MRVVMPVRGSGGDVFPVIQAGQALCERGHQVIVVTQAPYQARVEGAGLAFQPLSDDFSAWAEDEHLLLEPQGAAEFWRRHVVPTLAAEVRLLSKLAPSLLVLQPVYDLGGRMAATLLGVPTSWIFISPGMFSGGAVRLGLFQELGRELNAVREDLGLSPLEDFRPWVTWPAETAAFWPPWFAPDLPPGPTPLGFLPQPGAEPRPDRRIILISGSTGRFLPGRLYEVAVSACTRLRQRALVLSSFPDPLPGGVPEGVEVSGFRPHAEVMCQALAVVHHGGVGTSAAALACGVPQVVLAAGADRPDNGARLERIGVGRCLLLPQWTEASVAAALHDVLTCPQVADRCRHYRTLMQRDDPLVAAASLLERAATAPPPPVVSNERLELARRVLVKRRNRVTAAQERLWMAQQVEPQSTALNKVHAVILRGRLDRIRLRRALDLLLQRHAVLRTAFAWEDGLRPLPAASPPAWTEVDARHVDVLQHDEFVDQTARRLVEQPYNLARGPLVRPALVQLTDDVHVLFLGLHAVVADASSIGVLWRDLGALYTESPLPASLSYAEVDHERPHSPALLAWWRDRLEGAGETALPRARSRPARLSGAAGSHILMVTADLRARLEALARQQQVSLLVVLLAAFKAWLLQETGQTDLTVGTRVALRLHPDARNVVGPLANTLALRTSAAGQPTFLELLERVRDTLVGALEHQDLPFQRLVEGLNPPRQPNRHPFFSMVFYMQNEMPERVEWGEVDAKPRLVEKRTATDDLVVACRAVPAGLRCVFEYRTDLYDGETIRGLAADWGALLSLVVDQPHIPLSASACPASDTTATTPAAEVVPARAGELAVVFAAVLGRESVGVHDNFFRLGGHSMLVLRLAAGVSRLVGRTVPLSILFQAPTPAALALALEGELRPPEALVTLQRGTGVDSLFVVHAAGGGLEVYSRLVSLLPHLTVHGLQALSDGAVFRHRDMDTLARHYADEIRQAQPVGPYHVAGLSLGARIALHVMPLLPPKERGLVILLDGWGPGYPRFPALPVRIGIHLRRAWRLPPGERQEYLRVRLAAAAETASARWRRVVHELAPTSTFEGHFSPAVTSAVPPRYDGPVLLLRAAEQPTGCTPDPRLGWCESLLPNLRIEEVSGYHGYIMSEPHVHGVAAAVGRALSSP